MERLAARISAKLEDGNFNGAVRLAASKDSIAEPNEERLASLQDKHPSPHPNSCIPAAPTPASLIHIPEEEVPNAIMSFPFGSAAGPDRLCPQHLKDMMAKTIGGSSSRLLTALTKFFNLMDDA